MSPIRWLHLEVDPSWSLEVDRPDCRQWKNAVPDLLSLHWFPSPPDIPPGLGMTELRSTYRERVEASGGGLVELGLTAIRGVPSLRLVQKIPRAPGGWVYVGSVTIPFRKFQFVAEVQSAEWREVGVREACVFGSLLESSADLGHPGAWSSAADDARWDRVFPDHPLSKVRRLLNWLDEALDLDPAILPRARYRVA